MAIVDVLKYNGQPNVLLGNIRMKSLAPDSAYC